MNCAKDIVEHPNNIAINKHLNFFIILKFKSE